MVASFFSTTGLSAKTHSCSVFLSMTTALGRRQYVPSLGRLSHLFLHWYVLDVRHD
jgi:hypothetical protein